MSVVCKTRTSATPDGARSVGKRRAIGAAGALLALVVSSWSHVRGGGSTGGIADLIPLLVAAPFVGAFVGHRRWSFGALIAALVVLQPVVHLTMSRHGQAMGGSSSMRVVAHGSSPWAMVAMHSVGVVIVAVTLRYGWRWVSTMPALLAAVLGLRRPSVSWRMPQLSMLAIGRLRAPLELAGIANWSRGPPR